jgi:hypothetical protein
MSTRPTRPPASPCTNRATLRAGAAAKGALPDRDGSDPC